MHLVVGLGNPGTRYAKTRHNIGFVVVERLAARSGVAMERKLFGATVGDASVAGTKVLFALPQQFMNLSGQPVASLLGFYKIPADRLLVVHDDMDLPFGKLRVRVGGGHGGHNGVRDIHRLVGPNYPRVRVGVGRPPEKMDPADWVLAAWSAAEAAALPDIAETAANAVESVVRDGVTQAMNTYNAA